MAWIREEYMAPVEKENQEFIQMPRKKKTHLLQTNKQYAVIFFRVLL